MKSIIAVILLLFSFRSYSSPPYVHNCENEKEGLFALACNIYWEARGESKADQLAVGFATLNRVRSKHYPDSVSSAVYQRKQYSWTHDGKSDKVPAEDWAIWTKIVQMSSYLLDVYYNESDMYNYELLDITEGSLYYYSDIIDKPYWIEDKCFKVKIGKHRYYYCAKRK